MSDDPNDTVSTRTAAMDADQFARLLTTVVTALRQTPPQPTSPLSSEQQSVALKYRLLRNGLGRFSSASEAFDRALIRIDQVQHGDSSELVFHDPIPPEARSMVLVVDTERDSRPLDGTRLPRRYGGVPQKVVELVELLDQLDVVVAAGVPLQVQGDRDRDQDPSGTSGDLDGSPPYGIPKSRQPRSQRS